MRYDLNTLINRKGKDAIAWDGLPVAGTKVKPEASIIPMWIADINFPTSISIQEAIKQRVDHPAFGYFMMPDAYYDAIINWHATNNNFKIKKENITYENGVLGGIKCALLAFTSPGESILLHAPAYIGFTHTIDSIGRKYVLSDLKQDENGIYRLDLKDMEEKIKKDHIHVCIFSSPQNPIGRVWTKKELTEMMALFEKYNVLVLSDEIWSDLIMDNHKHYPLQTISNYAKNNTIAFYAISKTFNCSGFSSSYHIILNKFLNEKMNAAMAAATYTGANILSIHALIGAYSKEGKNWLSQVLKVLNKNINDAMNYLEKMDGISATKPEGTYMLYLDFSEYVKKYHISLDEILAKGIYEGILWQDGRPFHHDNTIRLNLALPNKIVHEAFKRIMKVLY